VRRALDLGETSGRMRRSDLEMPYRRARVTEPVPGWVAYAPLLRPGERFSHSTAAELWGAPLPARLRGQVHTSVPLTMSRAKSAGVHGHQTRRIRWLVRHGVPVSTPEDLLLELAPLLSLEDAVALGDFLILDPRHLDPHDPRPHSTGPRLQLAATRYRGRGAARAREAVHLVRPGVESPMETRLRLLLCTRGIAEPVCGFELTWPSGRTLGWFDLAWPEFRVIAEYDGDQHRTSTQQYERDIRRFDDAESLGWRVIRVRSQGVGRDADRTAARVRDALARRGWDPATASSRPYMPPRRARGDT
jgi:very-short-patch-repair endonuclease